MICKDNILPIISNFNFMVRALEKVHSWKQLVGFILLILILPVIQLFPSCSSSQSASYGITIVFGLILLCFYIIRKSGSDNTIAAYARGNLNGYETLLHELEKEIQTTTDKKEIESLKKVSLKIESRLETHRRVYKSIKKI
jgi:hypothetical protein